MLVFSDYTQKKSILYGRLSVYDEQLRPQINFMPQSI